MFPDFNNNYLYTVVELQRQAMEPFRQFSHLNKEVYKKFFSHTKVGRSVGASFELFERMTRHYKKPEFGIAETIVDGKKVKINEKTLENKTFCDLLHFKKEGNYQLPKMLVVAPMSGHYATLLRGTVEGLLPHFDVYITDWVNANEVPVEDGSFKFDTFVSYVTDFIKKLGPDLNVLAVCQPSVPVAAAVSIMSEDKDPNTPVSLTLMGGPIDTRHNPTEVNDYAAEKTIRWFETNVITKVPFNYPGAGRQVYPGFTQLFGFMAMNMQTHLQAHWDLFNHLVEGDGDSAETHKKFYNEYLSVMDLPSEFYLDTVNVVFKKHLLPRGKLVCNGRVVNLANIDKTALLCIEGEKDDISGIGQTKAAIKLCVNIPDSKKKYHLQKDVGHYGIFNGRRYREHVVPVIKEFIAKTTPVSFKEAPLTSVVASVKKAESKPAAKKAAPKKAVAKKSVVKKSTAASKTVAAVNKGAAKKVVTTKVAAKKPVVKKAVAAKKIVTKKVVAKKPEAKKVAPKKAVADKKPVAKKVTAKAVKKAVPKKASVATKSAVKKATAVKKVAASKPKAAKPVIKKAVAPAKKVEAKKPVAKVVKKTSTAKKAAAPKKAVVKANVAKKPLAKKAAVPKKAAIKKAAPKKVEAKKPIAKKAASKKVEAKKPAAPKKPAAAKKVVVVKNPAISVVSSDPKVVPITSAAAAKKKSAAKDAKKKPAATKKAPSPKATGGGNKKKS